MMKFMLSAELSRKRIVDGVCRLEKKNTYTQSEQRKNVDRGFSDCSSLMAWAYMTILRIDICSDTPEQILSLKGVDIDQPADGHWHPDAARLKAGDLLFFRGSDPTRPFGVGHVEMYIGDGQIIGHNDNGLKGPTIKEMETFCQVRRMENKSYIKTRRFIF